MRGIGMAKVAVKKGMNEMWLGSLLQGNDICRLDLAMHVALVLIMDTNLALVNRNLS